VQQPQYADTLARWRPLGEGASWCGGMLMNQVRAGRDSYTYRARSDAPGLQWIFLLQESVLTRGDNGRCPIHWQLIGANHS
jgi:hypothetical protein